MAAFTPNSELDLLVDPKLLSENLDLGPDLHVRSQRILHHGLFELLRLINQPTPDRPTYTIICIVRKSDDKLVASGSLFLEQKFIRAGGTVGHIEDIVVDPDVRGKSLGRQLIRILTETSERLGAYKTILDCKQENIGFYEKCGYEHKEYEMVRYTPEDILVRHKKKP